MLPLLASFAPHNSLRDPSCKSLGKSAVVSNLAAGKVLTWTLFLSEGKQTEIWELLCELATLRITRKDDNDHNDVTIASCIGLSATI